MGFKFFVEHSRATGCAKLAIVQDGGSGRSRAFVQTLELKSFEDHVAIPQNEAYALVDDCYDGVVMDFLQAAADAAWEQGIRPSQSKDMTNEVAAVRYHLEDMRKIALGAANSAGSAK